MPLFLDVVVGCWQTEHLVGSGQKEDVSGVRFIDGDWKSLKCKAVVHEKEPNEDNDNAMREREQHSKI